MLWTLALACTDPQPGPTTEPAGASDCDDGQVEVDGRCVLCDSPTGTLHERHAKFDGEQRTWLLHVPEAYRCEERWPVLFDLHGTAGDLPEEAYGLDGAIATADAEGFLLVRPRSRSGDQGGYPIFRWDQNPGDTERNAAFLEELLDRLRDDYAIDADRVYVLGFSSGTNQAARAALESDSPFHGFGHVGGGAWSVEAQEAAGRVYLHTPYRDYMRIYHHQLVELLDEAGVPAEDRFERTSFSGHDLYDWIYPEAWAFLDRGERPASGAAESDWQRIEGAPEALVAVAVDPAGTPWFTGVGGAVLSWDGASFEPATVQGVASVDEPSLTGLCFTADGRGAAAGNGTVLWTDDAGATWRHLDPLPEPGPPMFGSVVWPTVACDAGSVLGLGYWSAGHTTDGATWSDAVMGTAYRAQAQAAARGPTGTWVAGGYYAYLARSEDDAATFSQVRSTGAAEWVLGVAAAGPERFVAVGDHGVVLLSEDDGRQFGVVASGGPDLYAVAFADPDRGLAVGAHGAALATTDGGRTWSDVSLGEDRMLSSVAFLPGGDAVVAGDGGPWRRSVP